MIYISRDKKSDMEKFCLKCRRSSEFKSSYEQNFEMEALRICLILLTVFFKLTTSQDTELNCNGKEFKCVTPNEFLTCSDADNGEKFTNNLQPEKCPEGFYCNDDDLWKCDSTIPPTSTTSTAPTSTSDAATTITENVHVTEPIVAGLTIELNSNQELSNGNGIANAEELEKDETHSEDLGDSKVPVKEEAEPIITDSTQSASSVFINDKESSEPELSDNAESNEPSDVNTAKPNEENTQHSEDSTKGDGILSTTVSEGGNNSDYVNTEEKPNDSQNIVDEAAKVHESQPEDPIEQIEDTTDSSSDDIVSKTDSIEPVTDKSDSIHNQSIEGNGIETEEPKNDQIVDELVQNESDDANKNQSDDSSTNLNENEHLPTDDYKNEIKEENEQQAADDEQQQNGNNSDKESSNDSSNDSANSESLNEVDNQTELNAQDNQSTSEETSKIETATVLNNNEPNVQESNNIPIDEDTLQTSHSGEANNNEPTTIGNVEASIPSTIGPDQIQENTNDAVPPESDDNIEVSNISNQSEIESDTDADSTTLGSENIHQSSTSNQESSTQGDADESISLGFEDNELLSTDQSSNEIPNESESIPEDSESENISTGSEDTKTTSTYATESPIDDENNTAESESLSPEDAEATSKIPSPQEDETSNTVPVQSETENQSPSIEESTTNENSANTDPQQTETTTNSESISEPFECTAHGSFPNQTDCHSYVICVKRFVGFIKIERTCPLRFAFSPLYRRCSRDLSPCAELGVIPKCNAAGHFPDPENESKFYWCIANPFGEFLQYSIDCPKSSVFVPNLNRCEKVITEQEDDDDDDDDEYQIDIAKLEQKKLKAEAKQRAKELKEQEKAEKKALKLQDKEDRLIFKTYEKEDKKQQKLQDKEEKSNKTPKQKEENNASSSSVEENDFLCPSEGNFPDLNDCTRYIVCSLKKQNKFKKNYLMCPDGQKYDSITNICMEAEAATCS